VWSSREQSGTARSVHGADGISEAWNGNRLADLLHRANPGDFLAVSDRIIRNWIRRGELPSYKLGAARRIDPADVEDFLARHRDEAA
jgi:excisionase family DNA binding protein